MNTTLYVSKAGEQIYSDAQAWATRHKISLSNLVEILLDLTTDERPVFNSIVTRRIEKARARRQGAAIRNPVAKVGRQ